LLRAFKAQNQKCARQDSNPRPAAYKAPSKYRGVSPGVAQWAIYQDRCELAVAGRRLGAAAVGSQPGSQMLSAPPMFECAKTASVAHGQRRVLKEAECLGDGDRLGPVGCSIVTEVMVLLLREDDTSYMSENPGWRPRLPHEGGCSLADLLVLAEAARGAWIN
jgi:hypothetical protein